MNINDIIYAIEQHAPTAYAEERANVGLLIGDKNKDVHSALIALDLTEAVLQEAIDNHHDLIITHHPLLFKGLKKINSYDSIGRMVQRAISHAISVYAAHTNLDNAPDGVNHILARQIGLQNMMILAPQKQQLLKIVTFVPVEYAQVVREALFSAGTGAIGNYDCCSFSTEGWGTFRAHGNANPFVGEKHKLHSEKECHDAPEHQAHLCTAV